MNLRKAAQGQPCMVRSSVCNGDVETVVLAHIRLPGTGMGRKNEDLATTLACSACHDWVDGRITAPGKWSAEWNAVVLPALLRTLEHWERTGTIK